MTNEAIVDILNNSCGISLQKMIIESIGMTMAKVKDEDFKKKIEQTLAYLDCEAYNDEARGGFRIFAKQLLSVINE